MFSSFGSTTVSTRFRVGCFSRPNVHDGGSLAGKLSASLASIISSESVLSTESSAMAFVHAKAIPMQNANMRLALTE